MQRLEREEDRDLAQKKPKRETPPDICPLKFSMNYTMAADYGLDMNCEKERCYFYNRNLKLCAFVIVALGLVRIDARLAKGDLMKILKKS